MFNDFGCKFSNFRTKESGPVGSDIKLRNIQRAKVESFDCIMAWAGCIEDEAEAKCAPAHGYDMESKYF